MSFEIELKRALRSRLRRPWAGVLIVVTLALGIGSAAAMAGLADVALWRPLPFPFPDRLVLVAEARKGLAADWLTISYPDFLDVQRRVRGFEEMAIGRLWSPILDGAGGPGRVEGAEVSQRMLALLGIKPDRGRPFVAADFRPDAVSVVLVSDRLWRERFGADPGLLGKAITFDERPFTVVGILPGRAPLIEPVLFRRADVLSPLVPEQQRAGRGSRIYRAVARLREGLPLEQAAGDLAAVARSLAREHPESNSDWLIEARPIREVVVGQIRPALRLLVGAGLLVLLLACTNVASVLLAEAGSRRRELALQAALGAGRRQLVQTLAAESLPLVLLGLLSGLLVTFWAWQLIGAVLPDSIPGASNLALDGRFLALATLFAGAALLLIVGAPLVAGERPAAAELAAGSSAVPAPGRYQRARQLGLVAQLALATVLLIGMAMLTRSLLRLLSVDLGFRPASTLAVELELPFSRYPEPRQARTFGRELIETMRSQPGTLDAAVATRLPFQGGGMSTGVGLAPAQLLDWQIELKGVSPRYFATLGIPLLQGRDFAAADLEGDRKVVILNAAAARRLWPDENAVGRQIFIDWDVPGPREVVGVVGDVRQEAVNQPARPEVYLPYHQLPFWSLFLVVRGQDQAALAGLPAGVRRAVRQIDPNLPVIAATSMQDMVELTLASPRLYTRIVGVFTALGLLLALAGVFGVTATLVAQRRREIAVRLAVGARPRDIFNLILSKVAVFVISGLCLGLIAAAAFSRVLAGTLYEIHPLDAVSFFSMPVLLALLALGAAAVPAWRALRSDPARILKEQ